MCVNFIFDKSHSHILVGISKVQTGFLVYRLCNYK